MVCDFDGKPWSVPILAYNNFIPEITYSLCFRTNI